VVKDIEAKNQEAIDVKQKHKELKMNETQPITEPQVDYTTITISEVNSEIGLNCIIDAAKLKIKAIRAEELKVLKDKILGLYEERDRLDRRLYNQKDIHSLIEGTTTALVRNTIREYEDSLTAAKEDTD